MQHLREHKHENGAALILVLLTLIGLISLTALATDALLLMREKHRLAVAGDISALVGATMLSEGVARAVSEQAAGAILEANLPRIAYKNKDNSAAYSFGALNGVESFSVLQRIERDNIFAQAAGFALRQSVGSQSIAILQDAAVPPQYIGRGIVLLFENSALMQLEQFPGSCADSPPFDAAMHSFSLPRGSNTIDGCISVSAAAKLFVQKLLHSLSHEDALGLLLFTSRLQNEAAIANQRMIPMTDELKQALLQTYFTPDKLTASGAIVVDSTAQLLPNYPYALAEAERFLADPEFGQRRPMVVIVGTGAEGHGTFGGSLPLSEEFNSTCRPASAVCDAAQANCLFAAGFPEQSASTQCSAAVASCMSEAAAAVRACMTIPDQLQQYSCVRRAGERRTSCVLETNASHPACNAKKYCQDEANTCYNKSAHPMEEYAGMLREKLVQRYNAEVYTVGFVDVVGSHSSPLDRRHDTLIETTGDLDTFHRTLIRYTCSSIPKHEQSGHYFEPHSLDEFDDIVDGILNDSSAAAAPAAQAVRLAAHLIQ